MKVITPRTADSPTVGPGSLTCGFHYQIWIFKNKPTKTNKNLGIVTNAVVTLTLSVMFAVNFLLKNVKERLQIQSKNFTMNVSILKLKINRVIGYHMSYVVFVIKCYAAVEQTKKLNSLHLCFRTNLKKKRLLFLHDKHRRL